MPMNQQEDNTGFRPQGGPAQSYLARSIAALILLVAFDGGAALAQQGSSTAYYEFMMARRLETAGKADEALKALERAAAADPKSAEIWAEIASLHLRRNPPNREAGEKAAKQALALDEKNVEANRTLGYLYANAVDPRSPQMSPQMATYLKDAIAHLERAQAGTIGTDANLLYTLGGLYVANDEAQKAIQVLTRVVGQNPNNPQGLRRLAEAYAAADDVKGAIAVLEDVVTEVPNVANDLGRYQERAGLLREAAVSYTIALVAQPNNRGLKFDRVRVLYLAREYSQAAAFAGEARKQHPEDLRFAQLQARALFDAGDRSAGIAVAESTARAFPKDTPSQFTLVDLYQDAGRDNDAERILRQILSAEPANPNALNTLGYMLAMRGEQLDEAISLVRRALEKDPDNGAYLDSLGWAHFRRGDLAEAQKYLSAAAERMPDNSEVLDHLGDLRARQGQLQDAISAWTRALAGNGDGIDRGAIERKVQDARRKLAR
jgi:tetratricopeptide (TPR) repeat protein